MNNEVQKIDWPNVKAKLKTRFGKLTDESIDAMKGSLDHLSEKLQAAYGYAKEKADIELEGFKKSLHAATAPAPKTAKKIM